MADPTPAGPAPAPLTLDIADDGVGVLTFDDPERPHNILSAHTLGALDALVSRAADAAMAGRLRALVIRSGKPGSFIAGADVREIAAVTDPTEAAEKAAAGQRVLTRIEALPVPTLAAVNGVCLGGGTELILCCDRRLAADADAVRIGLPEVRLGIIPAFGGTTRLPRLIGLRAASEIILTGKPVSARKAERIGLVDERVPPELLDARALQLARELAGLSRGAWERPRPRRVTIENAFPARKLILWGARRNVLKETRGHYPAPLAAVRALDRTLGEPLDVALGIEAQTVGELVTSEVAKNLIHVFFLMEGAKKKAPAAQPLEVERVGVLGAGTMGGGIAQLLAYRGIGVRMKDIRADALAQGLRHARELFEKLVRRRKLEERGLERAMERISATLDYSAFRALDLVIEAVVERLDVKRQVLRETEAAVRPECVLATNTSSLSVTAMQESLERPDRFCGMHFFNPVHRMPLVEVVRGERSSDEAVATVFALARRLEKTPVIVKDGPGFLVNRLLSPYLNEAGWLIAEGAAIERVDGALRAFGMPIGPLRLLDEVGLDVARHAGRTLHEAFGERMAPAPPLLALDRSDRLGRKGGRGFYLYEAGEAKGPDPAVYEELGAGAADEREEIGDDEIVDRTVLAMVNEAARALEDGIVAEPGDVDLAMITGTGFPPFRGGLLRYADARGLPAIVERLESLAQRLGPRFEPAPLLRRHAAEGRGFYG